jgi:hypothetical protein
MIEEWKEIIINNKKYPYLVSNTGMVKSLDRVVSYKDGRQRKYKSQIIKPRMDTKGYWFVTLYTDFKEQVQIRVHQLVAKYYIPNPENKTCINHKDGNRLNPYYTNLEWVTHKENTQDAIKRGSIYKPGKKIDLKAVSEIRKLWDIGEMTQKEIGLLFGLQQPQVCRIINHKNWNFTKYGI